VIDEYCDEICGEEQKVLDMPNNYRLIPTAVSSMMSGKSDMNKWDAFIYCAEEHVIFIHYGSVLPFYAVI